MFRHGLRRFATAAAPVVADPSPYLLNLAKAQGTVKGLTGAIGNTPLIRLNKLSDQTGCEILGKAEFMNPGGSGIGQGRVTDNLRPDIALLDGSLHISDEKSIEMVYRCLDEEGLYLGASSSLNVVAAKEVAEKLGRGHTVVTMLCDGAYRYADRLFSRKWLEAKNLAGAIPKHLEKYIVLP
ncbi:hypothetical protein VdG1_04668 [Verticillium dahliae VDG1]|nr:hypothetical protein VdG1_04668 [Verticillium dahliae VDG1]